MTDEQIKEARRLYVYDDKSAADIAAQLAVPIHEIRAILKINAGAEQVSKPPRPEPLPPRPQEIDPDYATAAALTDIVQRRLAAPSYSNGTRRDGSPAPYDPRDLFRPNSPVSRRRLGL